MCCASQEHREDSKEYQIIRARNVRLQKGRLFRVALELEKVQEKEVEKGSPMKVEGMLHGISNPSAALSDPTQPLGAAPAPASFDWFLSSRL